MEKPRLPRIRSVLATAALVPACGCTQLFVRADWNEAPTWAPLQPVYFEVSPSELYANCRISVAPGFTLYGCARRDYWIGACLIFTPPNPEPWLLEHERKHCAGWDHGSNAAAHG